MPRIFHNIRFKLLSENKEIRYLKYAFGEILLVVLGILLALKINSWNQDRLDRNYELIMLNQIKSDLNRAEENINNYYEPRLKRREIALEWFIENLDNLDKQPDSTIIYNFNYLFSNFYFTYDTGAYESLKMNGLSKIKNEELRRELLQSFESSFKRVKAFIEQDDDEIKDKYLKVRDNFFQIEKSDVEGQDELILIPQKGFGVNAEFKSLLYRLMEVTSHKRRRLNGVSERISELIEIISQELKPND